MSVTATCKLGKKGCWEDGKCRLTSYCENQIVTNADRIRAMSDDRLREFLCSITGCGCCKFAGFGCELEEWLKQPAEVTE